MNELKIVRNILLSKGIYEYDEKYRNPHMYIFDLKYRDSFRSDILIKGGIIGRLVYRNNNPTFTVSSKLLCELIMYIEIYKLKNGVFKN